MFLQLKVIYFICCQLLQFEKCFHENSLKKFYLLKKFRLAQYFFTTLLIVKKNLIKNFWYVFGDLEVFDC